MQKNLNKIYNEDVLEGIKKISDKLIVRWRNRELKKVKIVLPFLM